MKNIIVITLKLLIITVIAGIILGVVNSVTKEPIAEQALNEANEARQAVFPGAADFKELDIDIPEEYAIIKEVYEALDADGNTIGITAAVITKGYSSGLNLSVGIGADGLVKGVKLGSNNESPGFGSRAPEELLPQFDAGKSYEKPFDVVKRPAESENEIEAISGATITSKGIINAVNTVVEFYKQMAGGAQ